MFVRLSLFSLFHLIISPSVWKKKSSRIFLSARQWLDRHLTCRRGAGELTAWLNGIVFAVSPRLIRETPAWVSGCWQADSMWWGALRMNMQSPRLLGEHCALCSWGRWARRSRFQQKQEVRIGGFLLPGPSFLPFLHEAKLKPCVFAPCGPPHTACSTGWLASAVVLLTTWDLRKHFSPSLLPLLFEAHLSVSLSGSLEARGKRFLYMSGLQRHTPPCSGFHSRLGTRWMWLGKYSSLSQGPKVISCYSSCHGLTRSRLRKMV